VTDLSVDRVALEERRDHVQRDLSELADQITIGEIDTATADRLESAYRSELTEIERALAALQHHSTEDDSADSVSVRRAIVGSVILVAGFTVAIAFIGGDTIPAQQGAAAGVDPTPLSAPDDAASLETMEQVVAADPTNVGLRLAVADAYFQRQEYSASLSHYLAALEADPTPQQESVALGRVGWMAFITGQLEAADGYLTMALEVDPGNVEGKLFLGYLRFFGFDDPAGAIPLLEDVLAYPDLGPELRSEVEQTLESARSMDDAP
jgi:tetratricopeptide (TPR) repeat protein